MTTAFILCFSVSLLSIAGTPGHAQSSGATQPAKAAAFQEPTPAVVPAVPGPAVPQAGGPPATTRATPPAAPAKFVLEDGTPVRLELTRDLSSADAKAGDRVDFQVLEDIKVDNSVVIPVGGIAWATITEAQHKRHLGRGGKLNLVIYSVRLADGRRAALRSVKEAHGGGHVGAMTAGLVATGIVFFPAAPLLLFVEGKDITIPQGTDVTAYVDGNFKLDPAGFPPESPESEAARRAAGEAKIKARRAQYMLSFDVKSLPDGAEIQVDGKLMGKTPATLEIRVGKHAFKLEKHGYEPWDDVVDVGSKTTTSISVTLSKK